MSGAILVTGASGFVGRRLVENLNRRSIPVIAVGGREGGESVDCDLRDRDAVDRLVQRYATTTIVHLAAMSSVGQDASQTWNVNFGGTFNLALACALQGSEMRFVFASSAEVYGASFLDGPCDEEAPLQPLSIYARSKAATEWALRDLASSTFKVLVARPFNHIGSGQDTRFVVPSFAAQIAAARCDGVVKVGNLDAMRDFSDVDDLVDALATLAQAPFEPAFGAFNIGSGKLRSIRSVLDELIELSGATITVELDPSRLRSSDVPVARGKLEAFDRTFGPRKHRLLGHALRDVLDAARSIPDSQ